MRRNWVVWAVTRYQNYFFRASFKIIRDHKALLSCSPEEKNSKTTQTRLVQWIDILLSFDYEIEHIPGKNIGLDTYISRRPVGEAAKVSQLDNTFVVAQVNTINRLIAPSENECDRNNSPANDVMYKTKSER